MMTDRILTGSLVERRRLPFLLLISSLLLVCAERAPRAQTGAPYSLERSISSSGGGPTSGGTYSLQSTTAQPFAGGPIQSSGLVAYIGFWAPELLPTAAGVSVSGRVRTEAGQGVRNVVISLMNNRGEVRLAASGSLGFYLFDQVQAGETYILTAQSQRFVIHEPTRVITVLDEVVELDFIATLPK